VHVHIEGTKHRGAECHVVRIYGYSVEADGTLNSATATRVDMPATGVTHIAGRYDIGVWLIRPVMADAVSVRVYTDHSCIGRIVKTKIADVAL
jgi:hypothetical protein